MSCNRIQKLLFAEYRDFEDMILVESPFAQTTRDGEGVRQVHLGLTPTKLVLAIDVLPPAELSSVYCLPGTDPLIDTLELIAIYPVECVNLSVFRRRKRQSIKAHFCNNRISYFELGGFEKRNMFWNLWCERLKFLCPDDDKSMASETSVATTTSYSTLQILESHCKVSENGKHQLWLKYGRANIKPGDIIRPTFTGDITVEQGFEFIPAESAQNKNLTEYKFKKSSADMLMLDICSSLSSSDTKSEKPLNERNKTIEDAQLRAAINYCGDFSTTSSELTLLDYSSKSIQMAKLSESAVKEWEISKSNTLTKIVGIRGRHPRRYGFLPQPHFLNGLGPWNLHQGDKISVQMKRSVSAVRIRRQSPDSDLCLPISKRLLTISLSCEAFHLDRSLNISRNVNKLVTPESPIIYFWTPEYWYRPQVSKDAFLEYMQHLEKIRNYIKTRSNKKTGKKKWKNKRPTKKKELTKLYDNSNKFSKSASEENTGSNLKIQMTSLQYLREILKLKVALRVWDFDSTTLAYQLTMIDKELFLKITTNELEAIVWQKNYKNIPNVGSLIAFSHRISNLIATEILKEEVLKSRVRLIVRFINIGSRCEKLNNFQSCMSVLNGLQGAPVYRLHETWAHLRKYYSMKYLLFESLCRRYSDPRLPNYQKIFYQVTKKPPFLPYIGDLLAKLLDKSARLSEQQLQEFDQTGDYSLILHDNIKDFSKLMELTKQTQESSLTNISTKSVLKIKHKDKSNRITNIFHVFKNWRSANNKENCERPYKQRCNKQHETKQDEPNEVIFYYQPLHYEDNREERLKEGIEYLLLCQKAAKKYAFTTHDLAKEYLLKARYREDRENFFNSFKLESKITFYNS